MTLVNLLQQSNLLDEIDSFYSPKVGFLRYNGDKWSVSYRPFSKDEKQQAYKDITYQICKEGLTELTELQREDIIRRINAFFTNTEVFSATPSTSDEVIFFNSNIRQYSYLSNFFHTLIVDSQGNVFPSSEVYYQSKLAKKISDVVLDFDILQPVKWKKKAEHLIQEYQQLHPDKTERLQKWSLSGMKMILEKKFSQNPVLSSFIRQTHPYHLAELSHTDPFYGTDPSLSGENHLGQILMYLREKMLC
jgi:ribA/ribD-fused uncharacterized protein